jgi:Leucine-rich repeat (LRR) protein
MIGGGSCSICKSPNTTKATCPCNPDAKKVNYDTHFLWDTVCKEKKSPEKKSPEKKSPEDKKSEFDNIREARIEPEKKSTQEDLESLKKFIYKHQAIYSKFNKKAKNIDQFIKSVKVLGLRKVLFLPETIGNLVNLTELSVSRNKLTSLPETIGNLVNLKKLIASNNDLTSLPETIGDLINLTELEVSNNNLISIPETIGNLTNLTHLYLAGNKLTSLPETIGNLTNLTHLYLGRNKLTSLPETIGKLVKLIELNVSHNKLISLPETISKLSLQILDIGYNKLEELPEIHATYLFIAGNPVDKYRKYPEKFKTHLENIGDKVSKLKASDDNRELQKMANEFCETFVDNRKINEIRVMAKRLDIKNSDKKTKEELCSEIQSIIVLKSQAFLPYVLSAQSF